MNRVVLGVLVLLVGPPLHGEDKPASLRQRYDALVKESQQAHQDFSKACFDAKTDDEIQKANKGYKAKTSRVAAAFFAIAEKNSNDPVAIDALSKLFSLYGAAHEKKKATALLLHDFAQSDKVAPICQSLASALDDDGERVLRTLLAKNPYRSVQAEASFALAQMLNLRFNIAKQIKLDPESAVWQETLNGKEVADKLRKENVDALDRATAKAWSDFVEKFSGDIKEGRLMFACSELNLHGATSLDVALRTLEKDKRRAVRGIASLTLGQVLKRRADALVEKDAKSATQVRGEGTQALRHAIEKYGDVKIQFDERSFGGIVGEKAERELYELRHLSIGMKVPEIEGEDQDGKRFKLSEYRGKVVLLDFWSQY